MTEVKLLALDLDGTLLTSDKTISAVNKTALAKARSQGVKIVLTTGRPLAAIEDFLLDLDLIAEDEYAITFNGGLIQRNTGEILDQVVFGYDQVADIYQLTQKLGIPLDIVDGGDVYALKSSSKSLYPTCNPMLNHIPTDFASISADKVFNKGISSFDAEVLDASLAKIPASYHERYEIFKSRSIILEWSPKGVHKANGLRSLTKLLGLTSAQVMACGDEANDLSMIEWAGYSVAMANATEDIKAAANIISPLTNDQDGVAWAVENYVLRKD